MKEIINSENYILFSDRIKLENAFYDWINTTKEKEGFTIKDCPQNVICFLEINDLLNNKKIKKFINKKETNNG